MTQLSGEAAFIMTQFFLVDPLSDEPKVNPKSKKKYKRALLKELETLTKEYEELDAGIDLNPYKEGVNFLKSIQQEEAYQLFLEDLLGAYD